jgi:pimeloyl-ACP methyl ester carboxylesterase
MSGFHLGGMLGYKRAIENNPKEIKMKNEKLLYLVNSLLMISLIIAACSPTAPTNVPTANIPMTPVPVASSTVVATVVEQTQTTQSAAGWNGNFEVNGHSLYLACLGSGSPTILLETGEGGTVSEIFDFQEMLAKQTMTCAYDRANTGGLRTAKDVIEDLHTLLAVGQVPGPYLLVGQSAGGLFVQLYARTFPDQVVGVVAMNPVPPAHPWLDEVSQIFTTQGFSEEKAYYQGQNGGPFDYLTSSEQLTAAPKPPEIPFEMLISTNVQCADDSTGGCMKSYPNYERIMKEVTAAWPQGNFSEVAASHEIYRDDPDAVMTVVERVLSSQ